MRVEIWSDLVCPWCYIGKRRFERAVEHTGLQDSLDVVHRAFQLHPDMPPGHTFVHRDVLMAKYRMSPREAEAAVARVEQVAAGEGLEFHLAGGVTGNTADAHQLVYAARHRGRQDSVLERLFRAHFTEQRSLFDRESLVALAADAGLAADDVRHALAERTWARAVDEDGAEARRLGIRGVPFFVIDGRFGISGARPADVFADALMRAAGASAP